MKEIKYLTVSIILFIAFSCSENSRKELSFLHDLKNELTDKYESSEFDIQFENSEVLDITFQDEKINNYSNERKQKMAINIGQLVNDMRGPNEKIKKGKVNFIKTTDYIVVKNEVKKTFEMY